MSGDSAGAIYAWGRGKEGQLGLGEPQNRLMPELVEALAGYDVVQLCCSVYYSAALTRDGKVYTWGGGASGKLGHGDEANQNLPRLVEALEGKQVVKIAVGDYHTGALTSNGEVYTCGWGEYGQLGHGDEVTRATPERIEALVGLDIVDIALGGHHSACLARNGDVYTWGWGSDGQLGHGGIGNQSTPKRLESLCGRGVTQIECGVYHTAALGDGGKVFTWGWGKDGRLGHGMISNQLTPRAVETLVNVKCVMIGCGSYHTAALTENGEVYTWGWGEDGRLGHGVEDNELTPRMVETLRGERVVQVACGGHHTLALTDRGDLYAWGWGEDGKLGLGNRENQSVPKLVDSLRTLEITALSCGYCHSAAIVKGGAKGRKPAPLKRQSSNDYREVDAEYVTAKSSQNVRRTPTPTNTLKTASPLARAAEEQSAQLVTANRILEEQVTRLKSDKEELQRLAEQEIEELQNELELLEQQRDQLAEKNRVYAESETQLKTELSKTDEQAYSVTQQLAQVKEQKTKLESEIADLHDRLASASSDESVVNLLKTEKAELQQQLTAAEARGERAEQQYRALQSQLELQKAERKVDEDTIAALRREVEHLSQNQSDPQLIRRLREESSSLEEQLSQARRRIAELEADLAAKKTENQQLQDTLAEQARKHAVDLENVSKSVDSPGTTAKMLAKASEKADQLEAELMHAQAQLRESHSREEALAARSTGLEDLVNQLREEARASDNAKAELEQARREIATLQAEVGAAENRASLRAAQADASASPMPASPGRANLERRVRELTSELETHQQLVNGLSENDKRLRGDIELYEHRITSLEKQLREAQSASSPAGAGGLQYDLERARAELRGAEEELARIRALRNQDQQRIVQLEERVAANSASASGAEGTQNKEALMEQVGRANEVMDLLQDELAQLRDQLKREQEARRDVEEQWARDKEALAARTSELMMSGLMRDVSTAQADSDAIKAMTDDEKGRELYQLRRKLEGAIAQNESLQEELKRARAHASEGSATEVARLRERVSAMEAAAANDRQVYESQKAELKARRMASESQAASMPRPGASAEDTISQLQSQLQGKNEEIAVLRAEITTTKSNITRMQSGLAELEERYEEEKHRNQQERETAGSRYLSLLDQQKATDIHEKELLAEREVLKRRITDLNSLLHQALESQGQPTATVAKVMQDYEAAKQQNVQLTRELEATRAELDAASIRQSELQSNLRVDKGHLDHERELLTKTREEMLANVKELRAANESLVRSVKRSDEQLSQMKEDRERMQLEMRRLRTENENLTTKLREARDNSVGIARVREIEDAFTNARAEAGEMGEQWRKIKVEYETFRNDAVQKNLSLRRELDELREAHSAVVKHRNQIEEELQRLGAQLDKERAETDALMEQVRLDRRRDAQELAKAQATVERAQQDLEYQEQKHANERDSLRRELAEMERGIDERDKALESAKEAHSTNKRFLAEITQLQQDNEALAGKVRASEKEVHYLRESLRHEQAHQQARGEMTQRRLQEDAHGAAQDAILDSEIAKRREQEAMRMELERTVVEAREEKHHAVEQARAQFEQRIQAIEQDKRRALGRMQADQEQLRKENQHLSAQLHQRTMELEAMEHMFRDTDSASPYNIVEQNNKLRNEAEDLRRRLQHLEEQNSRLKADREESLREARNENRRRAKEVMDLETQLTLATLDRGGHSKWDADQHAGVLRQQIARLQAEARDYEALKMENDHLVMLLARAKEERTEAVPREEVESHLQRTKEDHAKLIEDMHALRKKLEVTKSQRDEAVAFARHLEESEKAMRGDSRTRSGDRSRHPDSREVETLRKDVAHYRDRADRLADDLAKAKADSAAMREVMKTAERDLHHAEQDKNRQLRDLEKAASDNRQAAEIIAELRRENNDLRADLEDHGLKVSRPSSGRTTAEEHERLRAEKQALENEVVQLRNQLELMSLKSNGGNGRVAAQPVDRRGEAAGNSRFAGNRNSGASKLRIEEDMEKMRERNGRQRRQPGKPLFETDENLVDIQPGDMHPERLQEIFNLHRELKASTIERLNPSHNREVEDGVMDLLATSNQRIEAVRRKVIRLREVTNFRQNDVFDIVSLMLLDLVQLQHTVNMYQENIIDATVKKIKQANERDVRRAPRAAPPPPPPQEEPGFFEALFGSSKETPPPEPRRAPARDPLNSRAGPSRRTEMGPPLTR
eukprot:TRINITY_DN1302_c0_g1_i2.p1 TRINITY_DN1302_c0_g1~~TRINITY_DN1302_c0_g1_i2.p1  ORF type:complete len:2219 (+),score=807.59 TRINITY_DN1302_c0_g1_i2:52-6657(+)